MFDRQPLYEQVFDALAARIRSGHWPAGANLPNEYQLSVDLRVSIGTVRKAIEMLVRDGLVDRRQGKGTFVLKQHHSEMLRLYDAIRNADGSNVDWRYVRHDLRIRLASGVEQVRLRLDRGQGVAEITRVRAIGSRPAMVATTLVPAARFSNLSDLTDPAPIIVSLARTAGIQLGSTEEVVDICPASAETSGALLIDRLTSVIRVQRLVRDRDGSPIEISNAEFHLLGEQYRAPIGRQRDRFLRTTERFASDS